MDSSEFNFEPLAVFRNGTFQPVDEDSNEDKTAPSAEVEQETPKDQSKTSPGNSPVEGTNEHAVASVECPPGKHEQIEERKVEKSNDESLSSQPVPASSEEEDDFDKLRKRPQKRIVQIKATLSSDSIGSSVVDEYLVKQKFQFRKCPFAAEI